MCGIYRVPGNEVTHISGYIPLSWENYIIHSINTCTYNDGVPTVVVFP